MIRWVFLDVGNILLDEDPVAYHCALLHWEVVRQARSDFSLRELISAREERSLRGSRWPLYDVVSTLIDEAACAEAWNLAEREIRRRYAELSPLVAGATELVDRLATRFRLGLIANQGAECRTRLDELGLLDRFEVVTLSEEVGLFKPDPELYLRALREAGVAGDESVMIGDRLDNDVAPAGSLGMATIWVRWPDRRIKGWKTVDLNADAFRDSLQRTAARSPAHYRGDPPTLTVDDLWQIDPEVVGNLIPRT